MKDSESESMLQKERTMKTVARQAPALEGSWLAASPCVAERNDLSLSGLELLDLLRDILSKGLSCRFQARGSSMAPFVNDGEVITISPLAGAAPRIGEVVAFIHPEMQKPIVHRIIGKRAGTCLIKGDNIPCGADGYVLPRNILGRVSRVERKGRSVWAGLGPERMLLAFLSRTRLLLWLRLWFGPFLRPFKGTLP